MAEEIAPWLMQMINADFHTTHNHSADEKAFFCVDCGGDALTKVDIEGEYHQGHKIFQPLKNSGHYSYKKEDIMSLESKGLDVSGVRVFCINGHDVFFPKSRSNNQERDVRNKGRLGYCFTCGCKIDKPALFCSILCKLTCDEDENTLATMRLIMKQEVIDHTLQSKKDGKRRKNGVKKEKRRRLPPKIKRKGVKKQVKKVVQRTSLDKVEKKLKSLFALVGDCDPAMKFTLRKRSRKGVPHRAPLF